MGAEWRIYAVWICFAARLIFYASMLPLWEGYDEWAHFSVVRILVNRGVALVPRYTPVPHDVAASLDLAPVPWELRGYPYPSLTQDAFWKVSPGERWRHIEAFRSLPLAWQREDGTATLTAYESLQPPLYYWLMAPVLQIASHFSLGAQVMILRWISVLLASCAVPLLYLIAVVVFEDSDVALACAAVAALMPEWALDVARVSNDSLSVVFFSLVIWFGLKLLSDGLVLRWSIAMGVALGLGLLTKAWFLAVLPPVALLYAYLLWRKRTSLLHPAMVFSIAAVISAWWYIHNLVTTGTLSGLSESVMLRQTNFLDMLSGAMRVPWLTAIDSVLFSHLYFGGWSSLTVRAWMYHLFYVLIVIAAIGLFRAVRRPPVAWLLAVYAVFWIGQLYNVVLIFLSKGVPTSMGWYLYAVVAAEVILFVAGMRGLLPERAANWPLAGGVLLFGLLDLYTVHAIAMPYYTGLIAHRASGSLAAVHIADFRLAGLGEVLRRLAIFKGAAIVWPVLMVMWVVYLLATFWLMLEGSNWAAPGRRRDILR
jgi:4-amino-4-deoxy-L-arabinose transferase-like glycosyltransferase